jgi:predicted dehydrogenase
MDCCGQLLPGEPVSVLAAGPEPSALVRLEFAGGRTAQVSRYRVPCSHGGLRLQVVAERGTATAQFPHRLHWTDAAGRQAHVLPGERPVGQILLEQFYQVVRQGRAVEPSLDEAYRLLAWARAAARSRREGRRIELPKPSSQ